MKELEIDNYYLVIINGTEYIFKYVGENKWNDQLFGLVPESLTKNAHIAGRMTLSADLKAQNDELRSKLDLIQDAYLDVEIKTEVLSVEQDDESNAELAKARYMLGRAIGKTQAQSLADIRAEAVIKAANAVVRHNECGFCLHCLLIDHANKIKGAE